MEIDFLVTRPYVNAAGKPRISPIEVKSPRKYGTISLDRFRARFNKKSGRHMCCILNTSSGMPKHSWHIFRCIWPFACRDLSVRR